MFRRAQLFPLWSGLSLLAYAGLLLLDRRAGTLRDAATPQTVTIYSAAFLVYLAALFWLEQGGAYLPGWTWLTAVFSRLLLLSTTPTLSDDVYRLIWDGHLARNGISPYAFPVNAAALDLLEIPQRALVNNDWMASPYLPAAQLLFWLAALLGRQPILLQAIMVVCDLLAGLVIAALLRLADLPARRLLIYLWSPLVIVEVAHGAHPDAWMALLTLLAVWAALKRPSTTLAAFLSPFFLALATLTKLLPALLTPVLFWRWSWPQRLLYPALTLLILLPFGLGAGWGLSRELDGRGLFGAILFYTSQWKFNSGLFSLLEALFGGPDSVVATTAAKVVLGLALVAVLTAVFFLARQYQGARATLRLAALPFMAYILFTPTFHPWYLVILIAFLPFLPPAPGEDRQGWWLALPWLWLSWTAVFSYLAYLNPPLVVERPWVRLLQWLPVYALLALGLWKLPCRRVRPFRLNG